MKRLLILLFWVLSLGNRGFTMESLATMIWGDDLSSRARRLGADLPYDIRDLEQRKKDGFSLKTLDLSPARLAENEIGFKSAQKLEKEGNNDGALRLYLKLVKDWDLNSSRKLMDVCARGGLGLRKTERLTGLFLKRSKFLCQELALRQDLTRFYEAHGYYDTPWLAAERGMPPPRVVPSEEYAKILMAQPHKRLGWTEEEARAWLYSGLPAGDTRRLSTESVGSAASGGGSSDGEPPRSGVSVVESLEAEAATAEPGAIGVAFTDSTLPYSTPGDGEGERDSLLNVLRKRR
jgi:hypothetical protein